MNGDAIRHNSYGPMYYVENKLPKRWKCEFQSFSCPANPKPGWNLFRVEGAPFTPIGLQSPLPAPGIMPCWQGGKLGFRDLQYQHYLHQVPLLMPNEKKGLVRMINNKETKWVITTENSTICLSTSHLPYYIFITSVSRFTRPHTTNTDTHTLHFTTCSTHLKILLPII